MDVMDKQLSIRNRNLTKPAVYAGLIVILSLLPLLIKSPYWLHVFILIFIYIIATVSLRVITTSGQFPLAHAAFMGIGAYTSAVVSKELGWTPWLTIPLGALAAMVIGILIAYPFARLRAIYYAVVSLFFGIGVLQILFVFEKWTNAYGGLIGIPYLLGATKVPYYYFFLGLTSLCLLALYRFEFCRIGTNLKAIAQSYMVASSVGINEARYRVIAVAVGCFFVGLAGATYAHYNVVLSYTSFDMLATLWLVLYAIVGGMGSFAGPIIGTAVLMVVPELFRELKEFVPFLSAGILLVVVFLMPQGLVGLPQLVRSWIVRRRERKAITHAS
ncbi:MAG TPA: branched-chain amino acid ABC transporter permease [Dehalococcoidia bacterium]|nr:branched-chain amino acid ABC transporter permease [Dehalococcoidia bacterium]